MEAIGSFFTSVFVMETNTGIVNFVTNNAILLGILLILANGIARSTPWGWDNLLVKTIRNSLSFVKPDFTIPDNGGNNEEGKENEDEKDV